MTLEELIAMTADVAPDIMTGSAYTRADGDFPDSGGILKFITTSGRTFNIPVDLNRGDRSVLLRDFLAHLKLLQKLLGT